MLWRMKLHQLYLSLIQHRKRAAYDFKYVFRIYLFSFIMSAVPALFLSSPQVEDALGTMGAAAFLTGRDWGDFLVEKGFYYKYGMTLFYLPVYMCIHDPVLRYKALLITNSFLMAFIPVLIYKNGRRHLSFSDMDAACMALISGCMPSALLYGKLTWAEPVLFLIPWMIIHISLELSDVSQGACADSRCVSNSLLVGKHLFSRQNVLSAVLAWTCVYAFMCHQRGIVIVIATVIFLIVYKMRNGRHLVRKFVFVINLIAALCIDRVLDSWLKLYVFKGAELKHNLLSSFLHIEKYRKMLSLHGLYTLFISLLGWLYNSAVSGLGITLLGIVLCLCCGLGISNSRRRYKGKLKMIMLLGSLLFAGAFALGILFFFETAYDYWNLTAVDRCDHLVFGRYLESTLPVMMYIGLCAMNSGGDVAVRVDGFEQGDRNKLEYGIKKGRRLSFSIGYMVFLLMAMLTAIFTTNIAPAMRGVDCYVHSLMSMNICFDMKDVKLTQDIIPNLSMALIIFGVVSCICYVILLRLFRSGRKKAAFTVIGIIYLYIYLRSFFDILYRVDAYSLTDYAVYYLGH